MDEIDDPKGMILSKIASGTYIQYIKEDLELVHHNINNHRDKVLAKDNQLLDEQGTKRDFCPSCHKKYEFSNPPHLLKCCHRLCRTCMNDQYSTVDSSETKIMIKCAVDNLENEYTKPAALLEDHKEQEYDNFNAFLEILCPVDYELCNHIFYAEDVLDDEEMELREVMVQNRQPSIKKSTRMDSRISHTVDSVYRQTANREKFIEQLKYDCECPICMM